MSFIIIDEKLKLNRHFKVLNIAYLITVIPNLYSSYLSFFKNNLNDSPELIRRLHIFGYHVLPAISYLLFGILFLMIFISLLKREDDVDKNNEMINDSIYSQ